MAAVDSAAATSGVKLVSGSMVLGGLVLFIADRLGFGRERGKGIGGALGESLPPLIALIAALL